MSDVRRINKQKGYHFFDFDWIRFFGTLIESELYDNRYFITSEKASEPIMGYTPWDGERRYTIRIFDAATGTIESFSEFGEYSTKDKALAAINTLIKTIKNR